MSGSWTSRLDAGGARGSLELVVAGKYMAPDGRLIHSAGATSIFAEPLPPGGATYVSDLPWTDEVNGYGRPQQRDHNHGGDKPPGTLTIAGKKFAKGIGAGGDGKNSDHADWEPLPWPAPLRALKL